MEDHHDSRSIVGRILRDHSHRVTEANMATEGLALFQAGDFDLVICDIRLPDYNGDKLFRQMRELKPIKGIALTAYDTSSDRLASAEAGFEFHLTKPVELKDLISAITHVCPG